MQPVVVLEGVGLSRSGSTLLRDIDLLVGPGEVVGVAGPNGSGKTTLLRVLATLARPDRGHGTVLGAALGTNEARKVRPRIGLIGHEPALIPELTLIENLTHMTRLSGIDGNRTIPALEAVGLAAAADRPARAASRGMQRRVEIAHMLVRRPDLLLLDEAASGLDSDATGLVEALTHRVTGSGGAVVTVSHDTDHMTGTSRTVAISGGRLS